MSKARKAAQGQDCQVRLPDGICNWDPETTILAHLPGGGMGAKCPDYLAAFSCSDCHAAVDGPNYKKHRVDFYEGVFRTQRILEAMDILKC